MARKADGEKIDELEKVVATLTERSNAILKELGVLQADHAETARAVAELRREYEKDAALLKRELEDFRKWREDQKKEREEHLRRWWSFGPSAVGALINGLIAAAVAYFIARR